jgi:hypothetical protein
LIFIAVAGVSATFCSRSFHPIRCDFVAAFSGRTVAAALGGIPAYGSVRLVRQAGFAPQVQIPEAQPPIPTFADGGHLTKSGPHVQMNWWVAVAMSVSDSSLRAFAKEAGIDLPGHGL